MPELALLGMGPMGLPIANRLGAVGIDTLTWNRTPGRTPHHSSLREVPTPADAGAARVALTVLPDLPQVDEVLRGENGLLAGWRRHAVIDPVLVVHGTVSPVAVAALADQLLDENGVHVIDAPMSGGTIGARDGALTLMLGGSQRLIDELMPVFSVYGRTIARLGDVGAGSLAKACNQVVVASTVAAVSEAVDLGRRAGLDADVLLTLLGAGLAGSEILRQKSGKWRADDYSEGGSARNQLKDLRFAITAAESVGAALPVTRAVTPIFEHMVAQGDGNLDHTGVYLTIERMGTHE